MKSLDMHGGLNRFGQSPMKTWHKQSLSHYHLPMKHWLQFSPVTNQLPTSLPSMSFPLLLSTNHTIRRQPRKHCVRRLMQPIICAGYIRGSNKPKKVCTNPNCPRKNGHTIETCWAKGGGDEGGDKKKKKKKKKAAARTAEEDKSDAKLDECCIYGLFIG